MTEHQELDRVPTGALSIMSDAQINRSWRIAEALAKSGMFPDAHRAEQAFAKMLTGMDLGLSPTQALMSVHLVEGKVQIAATQLAAFVRDAPGYDYVVTEHDDTRCAIEFYRVLERYLGHLKSEQERELIGVSTFTIEDAERAGLIKDKGAWKKYPKNMLFARAMSNGVKFYAPDVAGGIPLYTEGDEFEARPKLTAGSGGEVQGLDLGPKVEAILERAEALGHAGLADRGAAEMALGHRSPDVAAEWCRRATAELDALEKLQGEAEIEEADVVEPTPAQLQAHAEALRRDAADLRAHDKGDEAKALEDKADEALVRAEQMTDAMVAGGESSE